MSRRITLYPVMAALVAAILAAGGLAVAQTGVHNNSHAWTPNEQSGLIFVAVLGSDAPTGNPDVGGGCDSIHIIAINSHTQSGTILNMPRDSFIGGRKITDICRTQGFDGGIATIKAYTGIPVQYWAHTNFSNFMRLIDTVGGLDIHVYQPMHNPADTGTHFDPGNYHMLGGDTLAFTRDRYNTPGGDFGRSSDQAQVIISGFRKFSKLGADMGYIFDLIRAGRQRVAFNVPLPDLIRLALLARLLNPANVKSCTLAGSGASVGGASVVELAGSNSTIYQQVARDASLPPNAQCFLGVNALIPPG
jgi:LCP family protein required for cell wall assembly